MLLVADKSRLFQACRTRARRESKSFQNANAVSGRAHYSNFTSGVLSSSGKPSMERLWQAYFNDPTKWWDNRINKHNLKYPDFRHKTTKEALWIDNWRTPEWVKEALERMTHSGSPSHGADRNGNAGHKRLPQLDEVKEIHSRMTESGNESNLSQTNTLIDMYVKCGSLVDARHVFDNMPTRSVVSWNLMILGYAKQEEGLLALDLYAQMQQKGVQPNGRTFLGALKAYSSLAAPKEGKQADVELVKIECLEKGRTIHVQVLKSGFESDVFVGTALVGMYTKCGAMEDAQHVFKEFPDHDVVSWTAMILGFAKEGGQVALELYALMHQKGVMPDHQTYVGALKACSGLGALEEGKQVDGELRKVVCLEKGRAIHFQVLKSGCEPNVYVGTSLVDMYTKCGSMKDARHVFDMLPCCDVVSWTAMILGYAEKGEGEVALELYARMQHEGVVPVHRTFVGALKACSCLALGGRNAKLGEIGCLEKGRGIHFQVVKGCFETDVFVGTSLVDMYTKCGSMEDARHVFDNLHHRDAVSWNTMIWGYAEQEETEEAFKCYADMQVQGLSADEVTYISILKACANTAALETGQEIHSQICRVELESDAIVGNTLIDMYSKCGSMVDAQQVFEGLSTRDIVTWNTLVAGYAHQGESEVVFCLLEKMRQEGVMPDGVTFLSVLTVCSHAGLVKKGQMYFQLMSKQSDVTVHVEHYNCMVDLLGRAGHLDKAVMILEKMPFQPDLGAWLSVLAACQKWKNVEAGRSAFEYAVRLDERNPEAYVLMSNIYAHANMWEDCEKIQQMRKDAQAWEKPGQLVSRHE